MHTTIVKLKNGKTYYGSIEHFRPSYGWFTLFEESSKFCFDECESVITLNDRKSINSPLEGESCDEMLRAKKDLDDGRKHGWTQDGKPYPKEKFEWEKRYERTCLNCGRKVCDQQPETFDPVDCTNFLKAWKKNIH